MKTALIAMAIGAWSIVKWVTMAVGLLFVVIMIAAALDHAKPRDTTDRAAPESRSNLILYTDDLTGCQYLRPGGWDGITPRIDSTGKPVCTK